MLFELVKMGFSSPGCAARDPLPGLSERPLTLMRTHGSTLALQSSIHLPLLSIMPLSHS